MFCTAYYEISIDSAMIYAVIEQKYFNWLNYVYAFGKNYLGPRRISSSEPLNLVNLFKLIETYHPKSQD